jgi:hypothetical protein
MAHMIEVNVRKKIEDMLIRAPGLAITSPRGFPRDAQHISQCHGWIAEALNIIELAVSMPSNAYRRQIEKIGERASPQSVRTMAEVLRALLRDIDAGLIATLSNTIRAETFSDFLDHATAYWNENRLREAGVIAGVVFEDTVRRICRDKGVIDKDEKLEDLINALAKQGTITAQQSKQAKVASHVRTKATHAQWEEFDLQGVSDTIQITRRFLQDHLGG